ncbi:FimB/Mfa2 family fimbrial subunit [Bacteroides eggerthii]|uniref:FimB/Mfa2 family fimbrial subunit n=1 Tax=Bacteroides eggerthii TaxID=28111 RepID=UPI0020977E21|nr:FimB/Mfa2 family fimbrial subunit [Bacteroides eggerthii]MCO7158115.1 FimB/Mfa2 family fimbrial subunit [Bacteroides eggerthii]
MKTRHLLMSLIALVAILIASCSEQQPGTGMEVGGTKTLTFRLTTDGQAQTRAAAPSVTGHKLQYILQVLDAGGNIISGYTQTVETGTFNVTLPLGVAYTCLFWAQYIPDAGGDNEFFDTADLKAVALKKALTAEDKCQAFCATASVAAADEALTKTVVMKRAVAQVNIKSDTQMAGYSKLTAAYTNVPNTFNVQDNTVTAAGGVSGNANFEIIDFTVSPGADGKYIYQSAYFLASADGTGSMLDIALNTYITAAPGAVFKTITVNNVPTKKNVRTNVLMDFAATSSTYTYTLDFADFDAPDINHRPPSTWNGVSPASNPSTTFSGGDGTQTTPYIIGSATDLAQLAVNTANGVNYGDKFFKLGVDIDLNNQPWTPIALTGLPLGTFDGQHHKITGLNVDNSTNRAAVGLFGKVTGGVSNLHVSGTVKATGTSSYAGGICGASVNGGSSCVLANCSFAGSVEGISAAGGIIGNLQGITVITSCKNSGTVTAGGSAGGMCGRAGANLYVFGCYNEGTITANNAGGVSAPGNVTISGCYNIGTVSGTSTSGAITSIATSVSECYVKAKIGTDSGGETVFGDGAWPTSTSDSVWLAAPNNDGTYTAGANGVPTGDYKFWKSLGSWNGGTPQHPKLWWEE